MSSQAHSLSCLWRCFLGAGGAHGDESNADVQAEAPDAAFLLYAADTWSPRGTLFNLLDNVVEAARITRGMRRLNNDTPGLRKSEAVHKAEKRARTLLRRARQSLDVRVLPPATRRRLRLEATLQLKEVLARIKSSRFR